MVLLLVLLATEPLGLKLRSFEVLLGGGMFLTSTGSFEVLLGGVTFLTSTGSFEGLLGGVTFLTSTGSFEGLLGGVPFLTSIALLFPRASIVALPFLSL